MPVFGIIMLLIQANVFFGSPPSSPAAVTALMAYFIPAAVARRLEKKRQ